jgi:predicted SAM-dependent methyltransferase
MRRMTTLQQVLFYFGIPIVLFVLLMAPTSMGQAIGKALYRKSQEKVRAWRSPALIEAYLKSHPVRKLQIGSGPNNLPGWLNTDLEPGEGQAFLDATEPFPLPDGSIHFVFSEHVIEHLTFEAGLGMLKECYRVSAPGGRIRIATPNLLTLVGLFRQDKPAEMTQYIQGKIDSFGWPKQPSRECIILNFELRRFGHQFVYDPETLRNSIRAAGFRLAGEFQPGQSDAPEFRGVDLRISHGSAYETMTLEAERP